MCTNGALRNFALRRTSVARNKSAFSIYPMEVDASHATRRRSASMMRQAFHDAQAIIRSSRLDRVDTRMRLDDASSALSLTRPGATPV